LAAQQTPLPSKAGSAWDHYFPFYAENVRARNVSGETGVNSFLAFLRFSFYRPRDINSMIATIQEYIRRKKDVADYVAAEDFNDPTFRDAHAEYLLGEIKDQLLFYYSQDEYNLFLQFFPHLRGKRKFTYEQYVEAFNGFVAECNETGRALPRFFDSANVFLQFLYEQNVISYKEHDVSGDENAEVFIRWCFRERTLSNMAPKVRVGVEYEIFYGLSKALNVGKLVRAGNFGRRVSIGTVARLNSEKQIGFIRGGDHHAEYYFKLSDVLDGKSYQLRIGHKVSFEVYVKYGKPRARSIKQIL
jgi:cold shock CspA family protein